MFVSERIQRLRTHPVSALLNARGSSKRWLAHKLGMHETQLNKYLSGALPAPADLYQRIADVMHVPVEFVTPKPEPETAPA